MIKLEEILPKNRVDLPGDNSRNNILIVGNARCGKSYLAEAIIKHKEGEFLLITDDWFESKLQLSSSQGTQKISGITSTTKPMVNQLILKSSLVIFDEIGFFLSQSNSQDCIDLARLALENKNITTIILAQSPNYKVLSKLFPEGKILFDKMIVGKLNYSEVANSFVKNLRGIKTSCTKYFDYSSEERLFLYYHKNNFQGILTAK